MPEVRNKKGISKSANAVDFSKNSNKPAMTLVPFEPLVQKLPHPDCLVSVVVPARNEAANILNCLEGLANQVDLTGQPFPFKRYEVILLANNCEDETAGLARQFGQNHPGFILHVVEITIPAEEACIGRARQLLMNEAYRRLVLLEKTGTIIASTDSDSRVASNWLAATIFEFEKGVDAVGGRILVDPVSHYQVEPRSRIYLLRDVLYRHLIAELETYLDPKPYNPWPRHFQHFGASLALTAEVYGRIGGIPEVRNLEDVALFKRLELADTAFRHSPLVRVTTSARHSGRVEDGLARQLGIWAEVGQDQGSWKVECANALEVRLRGRGRLRALWYRYQAGEKILPGELARVAGEVGVPADWLKETLTKVESFGWLKDRVEDYRHNYCGWSSRWTFVPIEQAIQELRDLLPRIRREGIQATPLLRPLK